MTYHRRRLGWQGLQKGTAVADADAIGCGPRELDGGRGTSHRGPLQEPFDRRDARAGEAQRLLAEALSE
jgi:hypothetical protein